MINKLRQYTYGLLSRFYKEFNIQRNPKIFVVNVPTEQKNFKFSLCD